MSGLTFEHEGSANKSLFFRRWLRNPPQMVTVIPSPPARCRRIAAAVERAPDEYVLDLGAGTRAISRFRLAAGVPADRLILVEFVPEMAQFLRESLPGVTVICGDAFDLKNTLPPHMHHRIGTVICGIPLVLLPRERQEAFRDTGEAVAPGKGHLLYTSCATSPLPRRKLRMTGRRLAFTLANIPPASVWRYRPAVHP